VTAGESGRSPETRRVELTLLGQTLTLRTEATPEYMQSLARYLERRVETLQSSGVRDPYRALMLAALDITDELFRERDTGSRVAGDVGQRIGALVAILEKATPRAD